MTEQAVSTPDSGALSIEQAVGLMAEAAPAPTEEQVAVETAEPEAEAAAPEAEIEALDDDVDVSDVDVAVDVDGAEGVSQEDLDPIAPPIHFDAEAKEKFAQLPRDMQAIVAEQVQTSMAHADRLIQAAGESKKAYEEGLTSYKSRLDHVLPQAEAVFGDKWAKVDWLTISRNDPGLYVELQAEYSQELQQLQALKEAKQVADNAATKQYFEAEREKLKTLAPELADPERGRSVWESLSGFLQREGAPVDAINRMSALEASIALKAMKWDRASAKAKIAPAEQPKQQAATIKAAKPTLRPVGAPASQSTSRDKRIADQKARLTRSGSIEDAVAFLKITGS